MPEIICFVVFVLLLKLPFYCNNTLSHKSKQNFPSFIGNDDDCWSLFFLSFVVCWWSELTNKKFLVGCRLSVNFFKNTLFAKVDRQPTNDNRQPTNRKKRSEWKKFADNRQPTRNVVYFWKSSQTNDKRQPTRNCVSPHFIIFISFERSHHLTFEAVIQWLSRELPDIRLFLANWSRS